MSYLKSFPGVCWQKAFHSLGPLVDSMLPRELKFDTKECVAERLEITSIAFTTFLQVCR